MRLRRITPRGVDGEGSGAAVVEGASVSSTASSVVVEGCGVVVVVGRTVVVVVVVGLAVVVVVVVGLAVVVVVVVVDSVVVVGSGVVVVVVVVGSVWVVVRAVNLVRFSSAAAALSPAETLACTSEDREFPAPPTFTDLPVPRVSRTVSSPANRVLGERFPKTIWTRWPGALYSKPASSLSKGLKFLTRRGAPPSGFRRTTSGLNLGPADWPPETALAPWLWVRLFAVLAALEAGAAARTSLVSVREVLERRGREVRGQQTGRSWRL